MKPQKALNYNDVAILPQFSEVLSRKDVNLTTTFCGITLDVPIVSANMTSVTDRNMAQAIRKAGGIGAMHRFSSILRNVEEYINSPPETFVSVGVGDTELDRASALYDAGARNFIIDVAHAASVGTVTHYNKLRERYTDIKLVVGNFATAESLQVFLAKCKIAPDAIKVGISGGSVCKTYDVTGVGLPTLQSVLECVQFNIPIIADGGHRTSSDIAKAIAAGASLVMLGNMIAGCDESPGDIFDDAAEGFVKVYNASASYASYRAQGKIADYRTPEGIETIVPAKGPVKEILQEIAAGLRSTLSYVGISDLNRFKGNAKLVLRN